MAKKKKTYNVKSRIVAGIRKVWRFSPLRNEVKKRCKVDNGYFRCEKCRKITDHVDIDHKTPVIDPEIGWIGYDSFIERLFCDIDNLWGICDICHGKKTSKENKVRKAKKTLDKENKKV